QMNQYREELENQYQMKREHLLALKNQQPQEQQQQMNADTQTIDISMTEYEEMKHHDQLEQLENKLLKNTEEKEMLRQRLCEVEIELNQMKFIVEQQQNKNDQLQEYESTLKMYEMQIESLISERNSLVEQHYEQLKQLENQYQEKLEQQKAISNVETEILNENLSSSPLATDRISRRIFEQELHTWRSETERLTLVLQQIQSENKKLKELRPKLDMMALDYLNENERLKRENEQLLDSNSFRPVFASSTDQTDRDICQLTLKLLTCEVALQTTPFENLENLCKNFSRQPSDSIYQELVREIHLLKSIFIQDDRNPDLVQNLQIQMNSTTNRLRETERQLRMIRLQNVRLKKQVENYTLQFKHVQHEMNDKIQEILTLKKEIDRLRASELQYRIEVDRLKAEFQGEQLTCKQLQRELADLKLAQPMVNDSLTNLRDILELKEQELKALKDKLDHTSKTHQMEVNELHQTNQFALDNVKRYEQLDSRHKQKRTDLEERLTRFSHLIRPILSFYETHGSDKMSVDELYALITDTEVEGRIVQSLGPLRDCLGLLEVQMKDLNDDLTENQVKKPKSWKYKFDSERTPES
ncbi:unnamed protein product, partial [Didymodactylos carnosus]